MSPRMTRAAMRQVLLAVLVVTVAVIWGASTDLARAQQTPQATQDMVYVVTFVDIIPTNREAGTKAVRQYVADTRKDPGIVRVEAVAQSNRENHLVVFEVWQDQKAFEAHEAAPHTKQFRATMVPLLGSPFDQRLHRILS